ncbi:hypothetical protein [Thermocrinis minervae]|uniref:Putative membrane protein n=1 Tax=Thermocrinis minervae TaxID=381751 RepID=A0A1M6SUZ1_9AQUI|nr:hypothetical protein [Thermocrinis minervae]SHK48499.1 putative membrane protein [Thermocrinis minervae]
MSYLTAKYLHLLGVFIWTSASSSLGLFMLYSMRKSTGCNQHLLRSFYRWMTNIEIAGFLLAVCMGLYMLHLMGYHFDVRWLNLKLPIVFCLFLPLEVINFYFVNFYIPRSVDKMKAYERYDLFNYIVAIPLIVGFLLVVYLAVVKP